MVIVMALMGWGLMLLMGGLFGAACLDGHRTDQD